MTLEEELAEVKLKIAAVEYLLSGETDGDPHNPKIAIYRGKYSTEELKVKLDRLEDEKKRLGDERLILLRQRENNSQSQIQSSTAPPPVDWDHVKQCVVLISNELGRGQGIAVSPRLLMTALHGSYEVGNAFTIALISGQEKQGLVYRQWFEDNNIDISLIKLTDDQEPFQYWLRVLDRDIYLKEKISIVSLLNGINGGLGFSCQSGDIFMFDPGTALCRSQYYAMDGLSGCAAITEIQADGEMKVVGVHVASHDDTSKPPEIKKARKTSAADVKSVSDSLSNVSSQLHGHSSYCLICIANRVPELMRELANEFQ